MAGTDTGTCPQTAPCKTIAYGFNQITTDTRNKLSVSQGTYNESPYWYQGAATQLEWHGHGATINVSYGDNYLYQFDTSIAIHDLTVHATAAGGKVFNFRAQGGTYSVDNVTADGADGVAFYGTSTAHNLKVIGAGGIYVGGFLTMDGAVLTGGGLSVGQMQISQGTVQITNMLIDNAPVPIDVGNGIGYINFSTIYTSVASQSYGVICESPGVNFKGDIVIVTNANPSMGCTFVTSLVGGTATGPAWVDPTNHDFHLKSTSPAIDQIPNGGPTTDLDGVARPQGSAFDYGAYEFKP
ncbi:MAG: choice-of-anchor Q domain-containing protein [Kofleriaceae bacterium]